MIADNPSFPRKRESSFKKRERLFVWIPAFAGMTFFFCLASLAASYSPPIVVPEKALSASFGEYRPAHLHAGIDIATFGRTGIPVRTVADGYVSRIRTSTGGYGNAVYIDHVPMGMKKSKNALRSVYGHLMGFSPKLAALLPRAVHPLGGDLEGETMESFPKEKVFVKKGEIIAWSGESGAGTPHLHYELRDLDDRPLNPVEQGVLTVVDSVKPYLKEIIIEPADEKGSVEGSGMPFHLNAKDSSKPVVRIKGPVRILAVGFDEDGRGGGLLGFTKLRLYENGKLRSSVEMKRFTYGAGSSEVALVYDYYRSGFSPTIYAYDLTAPNGAGEVVKSAGSVSLHSPAEDFLIEVEDLAGNRTSFEFRLISGESATAHRDGEWISPGGLSLIRNGKETRVTKPSAGEIHGREYVAAIPEGPENAARLAGGAILRRLPAKKTVFSAIGSSLEPPKAARGPVILLGPYGRSLSKKTILSLPASADANGIMIHRHGAWRWMGGEREANGELIAVSLPFLAPIVAARDEAPPTMEIVKRVPYDAGWGVKFRDDLSGVDVESIRVYTVDEKGNRLRLAGRFDGDSGIFIISKNSISGPWTHILAEASDRVGNKMVPFVNKSTLETKELRLNK